ncbi:hypothetical protein FRC03_011545 [Tulasnella sp. 419]|nr:hypothetical protein FRC03_011545 [Tulasnella sp. 419]
MIAQTHNKPCESSQHPLVLSRRTRSTLRSYNSSVTASLSGSQPPAFIDLAPSPQSSTSHPSPASAREMYELTRSKPLSTSSPLSQGSGGTSSHVEGFNPPTRPPPAANPQLWSWFRSVGEDHRSEITADELQRALCNGSWTRDLGDGSWTPLDLDTVYMLMDLIVRHLLFCTDSS